jgi:hypothetical protein
MAARFCWREGFSAANGVHINTLNSEIIKTKAQKLSDFPGK